MCDSIPSPQEAIVSVGAVPRAPSPLVMPSPLGLPLTIEADVPIKVGINGFGRIGRNVAPIALDSVVLRNAFKTAEPRCCQRGHGRIEG